MSLTLSSRASLSKNAAADPKTIDGAYPGDESSLLDRLIRMFEDAELQSMDARYEAEKARDFVCGKQWTAEEVAILRKRGQPVVWNNVIARKVATLQGMERRGRSDPKAYPRTPVEDSSADAATQALRYIADENRYDVIRSAVYDNMLVEGVGGCEVTVAKSSAAGGSDGYDVFIEQVPWDRLFYDPHSSHPAFTDAKYLGTVIWSDYEDALDLYPGKEDILEDCLSAAWSDTFDDKPRDLWADKTRRRVRVVQIHWKRKRDWWVATLTRGGFLEAPMISPYIDRRGDRCCPLILRSGLIDRDNNRFGIVRDMIPLQEAINKRESRLLHSLSVNQVIFEQGAVDDEDLMRREAAKPDGSIRKNRGFELEIHKDTAEIEGQFKLLEYSIAQMNVTGPNANMNGKDPREQSGRAIIAQQAGGQTENEPWADALRQHTHKVYEAAWSRVQQFWTKERWVRVTDDDNDAKFTGLNHAVTIADLLARIDPAAPIQPQLQALSPKDRHAVMVGQQLPPGDPRLQTVVRMENVVGDMDMDITVEEGPDNPTLQAEQFQTIMSLPPQVLQNFPPEFFIQASSLRDKDKLIKLLEAHQQQQAAGQQAAQAQAQAMGQAQVAKVTADAQDKRAQAVERLHGIAVEHADVSQQPVLPGIGRIHPDKNPLLQPPPAPDPSQAAPPDPSPDPPPDPGPDPIAVNQQGLAAQQQAHSQAADQQKQALAAQAQAHAQAMDRAKLQLQAQQQAHAQRLSDASHVLAVKASNQPRLPAKQ